MIDNTSLLLQVIGLLTIIAEPSGGGGGPATDVNVLNPSTNYSLETTQQLVLTELQRLANIEIDVDTINLNTDQLETLLAQISAKLPATLGKKASNLSLAVTLDTSFTQTVKDYYIVTTATNISGVAFNLNDIVVEYSTDLSTGGLPLSYLVNVTTGLNTGNVSLSNAQLNCFRPFTNTITGFSLETTQQDLLTQLQALVLSSDYVSTNFVDYSSTIAVLNTSQQIITANSNRRYLLIQNISDTDMYINFGGLATIGIGSIKLVPNGHYELSSVTGGYINTESIDIICSVAGKEFTAKEA
jgi:hypothetical protein